MAGRLPMGQKELLRGKVMEMAKRGELPHPKDKVTILIRLDDSFCIQWKKNSLLVKGIEIQKNDRSGNNAA
jgi:hypothetical protein